jgi:hypothetical protein
MAASEWNRRLDGPGALPPTLSPLLAIPLESV